MLSNSGLNKSFLPEAMTYAGHLINRLSSSAIGEKTLTECGRPKLLQSMKCSVCLDVRLIIMCMMGNWSQELKWSCFRVAQKWSERIQDMGL